MRPEYFKYGAVAIIAILGLTQLNKFMETIGLRSKTSANIKDTVQVNQQAKQAVEDSLGVSKTRQSALQTLCQDIYKAFYSNDWFGWTEDEEFVIGALNSLNNAQEAEVVGLFYKTAYSRTLGGDINNYLTSWQKQRIKTEYLSKLY